MAWMRTIPKEEAGDEPRGLMGRRLNRKDYMRRSLKIALALSLPYPLLFVVKRRSPT